MAGGRPTARGARSTTSSSWNCRAARSAATSGWTTGTPSTRPTGTPWTTPELPAGVPWRADRRPGGLPAPVVRAGRHRPGIAADADTGVVLRPRSPVVAGAGRQRTLRPQAARARGRGHRVTGCRGQRGLRHRQPRRGTRRTRVARAGHGPAPGEARLRQHRAGAHQEPVRQLLPARELPLEPPLRQLLGALAVGRERPHQPERRPHVRLPADVVRRERRTGVRPARHGPAAPVQAVVPSTRRASA